MKTSNVLRRVYGVTAALLGVLFFFIIVGVFGLTLAIAGLTNPFLYRRSTATLTDPGIGSVAKRMSVCHPKLWSINSPRIVPEPY
jgi:hypothetical protein